MSQHFTVGLYDPEIQAPSASPIGHDQASKRKVNQDKRAVKANCRAYSKLR